MVFTMKRILRIIYNLILAVLFVFLLAVAGTFLPIPGNYKIFTVQSGSMEPKIHVGSLIFVKSAAEYRIGDIVTFKNGKNTVTHRIVEKKESDGQVTYLTKGDANEEADAEETPATNVIGKTFLSLPYVGYPIGYARTKTGFILLVIIPSTIIVYEELYKIKTEISEKFKKRRKKKEKRAAPEDVEDRIRIIETSSSNVEFISQNTPARDKPDPQPARPPRKRIV
jgi:signal peptidase I